MTMNQDAEQNTTDVTDPTELLQFTLDTSGEHAKLRGLLRNNGDSLVSPVLVTVELLDGNGQVVERQQTYPGNSPDFALAPGQLAGFNVAFAAPASGETMVRINISSTPAHDVEEMPRTYDQFEVSATAIAGGKFGGKVRNSGDRTASHLLISVILYDRKNRVVRTGLADVAAETLLPGDETTFSLPNAETNVETWDVVVTARAQ